MMACAVFRQFVTAYVDGELVGEDRGAFEQHFASCRPCRQLLEDEQAVAGLLQQAKPSSVAPPALRARIEVLAAKPPGTRFPRLVALAATLVLAMVAAFLALGPSGRGRPEATSELASLAADTHLRYARGQLPLEVESERPDQISRFFSGRVPFRLALPDYPVGPGEQKFYRLRGGRLVSFKNDYAAYVAYRMDDAPLSLLVTSSSQVAPSGGEEVASGSLTFHLEQVSGLQVISWSDKGLTYALASDTSVSGARSCMVCHGSPEERRRVQGFPRRPRT